MGAVWRRAGPVKVRCYHLKRLTHSAADALPLRMSDGYRGKQTNMTTLDPLKSALSIGHVDDTSLALPSGSQCKSGQRRVLEQVQTVRRRSRMSSSRSGSSTMSPTSPSVPSFDSVFTETKTSTSMGGLVFGNGISKTLCNEKTRQSVNDVKATGMKRNTICTFPPQGYTAVGSMALNQTNGNGHVESDQVWQRHTVKHPSSPLRSMSNKYIFRTERTSTQSMKSPSSPLTPQGLYAVNGSGHTKSNSQFVCSSGNMTKTLSRPEIAPKRTDSGSNSISDITMKDAVEYLSSSDETYQHCGASYIQHNTFIGDEAKAEVLKLNGIPPLVALLRSSNSQVNQTATAALRNLSFKSNSNKEEIHRSGGVTEAVTLLRETDSVEKQKQLTGLLWNLSSAESLKPDLLKSALPVLMERAILPYTTGPERSSSQDPEVFFNATGCLRNLSSTKQNNRQAMRKCRGLVDSLVSYVKKCVDAGKPDDKSVENCVCILHNLTFQLEDEAPALFSRITTMAKSANAQPNQGDAGPIGCFSPQSRSSEHESHFDFPNVEDPHPSGAGLLIHSSTMQTYLALLEASQRDETKEACCGALQNLTAHESIVSGVMSQTIVQKLNGLQVISPLLKSDKVEMQRNAVALVGNLAKNSNVHNAISRKALPELLSILRAGTKEEKESDDTLAMACHTANSLFLRDHQMGKYLVDATLIRSLRELSQNRSFPKSSKAAALLLFNMWSEKDVQSFLKKKGMNKSMFVNDVTAAALKSVQVVD